MARGRKLGVSQGARVGREPYEALATRILHLAILDVRCPGREREDAIAFLRSSGAARLAQRLGYDIGRYRRGVARLMEAIQ